MFEAINFWIHLTAAAVWIGPQVFLPLAAIPAMRTLALGPQRRRALQVMTARFNYLSWVALIVLVITGIGNVFQRLGDLNWTLGEMVDARYGLILCIKLLLVAVVLALTAWHSFLLGPRMLEAVGVAEGPGAQAATDGYRRLQRVSVVVSSVNLLLGIVILYLVTLLQNMEFSLQPL